MKHGVSFSANGFFGAELNRFIGQGLNFGQRKATKQILHMQHQVPLNKKLSTEEHKPSAFMCQFSSMSRKKKVITPQDSLTEGETCQIAGLYLSWTAVKVF